MGGGTGTGGRVTPMGTVTVHPKPHSFCTEWLALKFDATEGITPAKKLIKGGVIPWQVHIVVGDTADPYLVLSSDLGPSVVHHGDWIVHSPHGKLWFLPEDEFQEQFWYDPES